MSRRRERGGARDSGPDVVQSSAVFRTTAYHSFKSMCDPLGCGDDPDELTIQNRFIGLVRKTRLPDRHDPKYSEALRTLHSAILGLCALIQSFPYSVEPWMPPLTDGNMEFCWSRMPFADTTIGQCLHFTLPILYRSQLQFVNVPPSLRR